MLRQVSGTRAIGVTVLTALVATPSLGIVTKTLSSTIHFDGGSLFLAKAILTSLLAAAAGLLWWSSGRLSSSLRRIQIAISVLHIGAFALLAYWFTGISNLFR
jgi:hypothetical protein